MVLLHLVLQSYTVMLTIVLKIDGGVRSRENVYFIDYYASLKSKYNLLGVLERLLKVAK